MENEESTLEAARRETWEEACARTCREELYTIISIPSISQVYMFYRAELEKPEFSPGQESLEVALFSEDEIPWDDLAFRTVSRTLEFFFADRNREQFVLRDEVLSF